MGTHLFMEKNMTQSQNPLEGYFRTPALFVKLPSEGKYYQPGSLDLPANGEVEVYPMTARDEILYNTPEALLNGSATVKVIESCIPAIKNAWDVPSIDLDAILISIRIASNSEKFEFSSVCPKCSEISSYDYDLHTLLDALKTPDFSTPARVGDLKIFIKPYSYAEINKSNIERFEEQQIIDMAQKDISSEEKLKEFSEAFLRLSDLSVRLLISSVAYIELPDENHTKVENLEHLEEFFNNCEGKVFNQIRDEIQKKKDDIMLDPVELKCTFVPEEGEKKDKECGHQYTSLINFETSNFFA